MKKSKLYFLISSGIQIFVSIISVLFLKFYQNYIVNSYKQLALDDDSFLASVKLFEDHGKTIIVVIAIVTIILNLITLYKIIDKKNFKATCLISSLIGFFINESSIISLLGLTNILVLFNIKNTKKKVKETIKIPKMEKEIFGKNEWLYAILAILIYFFLPELIKLLPYGFIVKSVCLDVLLMIILSFFFKEELSSAFRLIKKNFKKYFKYVLNKQWIGWGIYILSSFLVTVIKGNDATSLNQQLAESLPLLYVIPSCLIYAPLVEELVFRGSIRRLIKNDKLFIIISGLSFGLLHTLGEKTLFDIVVLSIPYDVLGSYFAYLYVKTDNIGTSIMGHFLHNALASLMLILS